MRSHQQDVLEPKLELLRAVQYKAKLRLEYEGLDKCAEITTKGLPFFQDPIGFAMHKFAYYQCFKCKKPYYGGDQQCAVAGPVNFDPSELICGACSPVAAQDCPKHGKDFLEFKC